MKELISEAFKKCNAPDQITKRAEVFVSRFEGLQKATSQAEAMNIFQFLEGQIFGTLENQANQILLFRVVKLLDLFNRDDDSFDGIKAAINRLTHVDRISNVVHMPSSKDATTIRDEGLSVGSVTWEDTARIQGSAYGRNISDLTLQLEFNKKFYRLPVIRDSNFKDRTADIDPNKFLLNIGNARGGMKEQVSLKHILENPWELLTDESKWPKDEHGEKIKLFAEGVDNQILVSAQACLVPIPTGDVAVYRPQIYNYQSFKDDTEGVQPYVLTILVTREGCSVDITGREWNQTLFFNKNGEKAPLTAKDPNDTEKLEMQVMKEMGLKAQDNANQHNRVMIIQVPLIPKLPKPAPRSYFLNESIGLGISAPGLYINCIPASASSEPVVYSAACSEQVDTDSFTCSYTDPTVYKSGSLKKSARRALGSPIRSRAISAGASARIAEVKPTRVLENAVIASGEVEGPYLEDMSSGWKRDPTLPVRVTVQLVKTATEGALTKEHVQAIKQELAEVYENASRLGSLVVNE